MDDNPYAPPRVAVGDIEQPMPARPRTVVVAVQLLWLSAACAVPTVVYEAFHPPPGASRMETELAGLLGLLVAFAIAYFLNGGAWQGRNWSRWALGILTAVSTLALTFILYNIPRMNPALVPWYLALQYVTQTILNIVAVALLCCPTSNVWYRDIKVARAA